MSVQTPTPAPAPPAAPPPDAPRVGPAAPRLRPRTYQPSDYGVLAGSFLSGVALAWVVCYRLASIDSKPGFAVMAYGAFMLIYGLVVLQTHGALLAVDRIMSVVVATGALVLMVPLLLIIGFVVVKGIKALNLEFLTETQESVGSLDVGGGAYHAIVGTLEQVAIAFLISVPLGVTTAIFLSEVGGRMARPVRFVVDALSGVPSIVAGLFVFAFWIVGLNRPFSGFAAAMALSVLMLPSVVRTTEEVFRLVPDGLREASLALGAPEWRSALQVVLPTARAGVVTAVILGMARAVGETAPLIMTSFGSQLLNYNVFDRPQSSLPIYVYGLIGQSAQAQIDRAWAGALVLIVLVLGLFTLARFIGNRGVGSARYMARAQRKGRR